MSIRPLRNAMLGAMLALALSGCAEWRGARLYQSGTEALDRGESERAIADLERAAQQVPQASEIQNHLGLAYAAAGRDEEALRAFRRAVDLDCENAAAAHNLQALATRPSEIAPATAGEDAP